MITINQRKEVGSVWLGKASLKRRPGQRQPNDEAAVTRRPAGRMWAGGAAGAKGLRQACWKDRKGERGWTVRLRQGDDVGKAEAQPSRTGVGMSCWLQEGVTIEIKGLNSICDGPNFLFLGKQNSLFK